MRYIFFTILSLLIFASCKDKQTLIEPDIDYGYDYFPLIIGSELVYRVDSIVYDPISETEAEADTNIVFIKEVVLDSFTDELGRLSYRIERSERPNVNVDWTLTDIWSSLRTTGQGERFEDNLRFVKMVFPVSRGDVWNGNLYLDETATYPIAGEAMEIFKGWSYEVLSADEAEQVGDFSFEQVTTILQADEENLLEKRYSLEKYAEGVGLVYREMEIYDTQNIDELLPWEEKANKGFKLVMTLVDYN